MRRGIIGTGIVLVGLFLAIQLVPYGWQHSNPPVTQDAPWPNAPAASIARTACYDCHSNETNWRWYSYIAPASWLVRKDVDEGRNKLNFSNWGHTGELHDVAEVIREGAMPPKKYTLIHPAAKLSEKDKQVLVAALQQMGGVGGEDHSGPG